MDMPNRILFYDLVLVVYFTAVGSIPLSTFTSTSSTSTVKADTTVQIRSDPAKPSIPSIALRTVYVVSGVCALVIIYFIIRAICTRRRKQRTRRYGILKEGRRGDDDMELHPLSELDDDDDDLTLFDANQSRSKNKR